MAPSREHASHPAFLRRRYRERPRHRAEKLLLTLMGALLLYVLILGDNGLVRVLQERREVKHLDEDLRWLRDHSDRLAERIEDLERRGSFTLEQVARERYGMIRAGERVIHVLEPGQELATPPVPLGPQTDE